MLDCMLWLFFFKQKTAYEMRISDWSSDVCSSDLVGMMLAGVSMVSCATTDKFLTDHAASYATGEECSSLQFEQTGAFCRTAEEIAAEQAEEEARQQIGRESCRERVCQYVSISGVAASLKKNQQ